MKTHFYNKLFIRRYFPSIKTAGVAFTLTISSVVFSSCFTGIESTKTVSLSREDKKILMPTPEEEYFKGVTAEPLSQWKKGKCFMASDNRSLLIFDQQGLPIDPDSAKLRGKILHFENIIPRSELDGTQSATIIFSCNETLYRYNTGKAFNDAPTQVMSDQIPMLIDLDMVDQAKKLLQNKKLWIRSPLWYDKNGKRIKGSKFVEITVEDIEPGDIAFPLKLRFIDKNGQEAWIFMNFGNSGTETRLFSNLFYLNDIRKKYPAITDETWEVICGGNVKLGMTKEECKLSLGNPDDVNRGHDYSQTLDLWQYPDGTVLWFEDGILIRFRK